MGVLLPAPRQRDHVVGGPFVFEDQRLGRFERRSRRLVEPATRQHAAGRPATDKQIAKIWAVAKEAGVTEEQLHAGVRRGFAAERLAGLTTSQASEVIDPLGKLPPAAFDPETGEVADEPPGMEAEAFRARSAGQAFEPWEVSECASSSTARPTPTRTRAAAAPTARGWRSPTSAPTSAGCASRGRSPSRPRRRASTSSGCSTRASRSPRSRASQASRRRTCAPSRTAARSASGRAHVEAIEAIPLGITTEALRVPGEKARRLISVMGEAGIPQTQIARALRYEHPTNLKLARREYVTKRSWDAVGTAQLRHGEVAAVAAQEICRQRNEALEPLEWVGRADMGVVRHPRDPADGGG